MELSVVVHPSNDHVSPNSAIIPRETETHIAEGLHLNLEHHIPLAWRPKN